jgi:2-isopropylmalate synthase
MPYLPIDPVDIGCTYDAVIRVNSQSGKGGIAYLLKQHLHLDLPRKMQIAFYQVIQAIAEREAREITVEDITEAFRRTYHYGGHAYKGRLALKSFKISVEPNAEPGDASSDDDERRRFDGTLYVDGVLRVIKGDGNGPVSAMLDALRTHLGFEFIVREYSEHALREGQDAKAASYVEIVSWKRDAKETRRSTESWWGVGLDSDITGSGLRAVLSAVNGAIGDRELPELKLSVGFNAKSGQTDVASAILNALQLELPRRFQASFFEIVQRAASNSGGEISYDDLTRLFQDTYHYDSPESDRFSVKKFKLKTIGDGSRRCFHGEMIIDGQAKALTGEGNGPLSAVLAALHSQIQGTLVIREYSEHSVGEGSDAKAASYVELVCELPGERKRKSAWGVGIDNDITSSGVKAALSAASRLDLELRQ